MTNHLDAYTTWTGGIDDLIREANAVLPQLVRSEVEPVNVRLIRDYINRGLVGDVDKQGRELVFGYTNLLRLIVTRFLLVDGWSLGKIQEFLDLSAQGDIEAVLPGHRNPALKALGEMREEAALMSRSPAARVMPGPPLAQSARASSMQLELPSIMHRLGQTDAAPQTEDLTRITITPWCEVLLATDRLPRLTIDEAEELGRAVTASVIRILAKRGRGK
jgi:DNA-binding transcriptional MerR regulator